LSETHALPTGYEAIHDASSPLPWGVIPPGQVHARPFAGSHATRAAAERAAIDEIYRQKAAALTDEMNTLHDKARYGVPAAPFVQKTEAWLALALKRMIRYAAEHGYDRVAWTTGEQQAERYDLSKHVSAIGWTKQERYPGTTHLTVFGHGPGRAGHHRSPLQRRRAGRRDRQGARRQDRVVARS
jgi:hypothetical protein